MAKTFRPYTLDQPFLLPPDLHDWLPEGYLALYVSDVFEALDLIVATGVTQAATDVQQLAPMFGQVHANTGRWPDAGSADAGYYSEANVTAAVLAPVDLYIPPDKQSHRQPAAPPDGIASAPTGDRPPASDPAPPTVREQMRAKVRSAEGHALYRMRKAIVEPVFGQTKERRGFRRFSLRGLAKVRAVAPTLEGCTTRNPARARVRYCFPDGFVKRMSTPSARQASGTMAFNESAHSPSFIPGWPRT